MLAIAGSLFSVSLMFYKDDENKIPGPYLAYYLWYVKFRLYGRVLIFLSDYQLTGEVGATGVQEIAKHRSAHHFTAERERPPLVLAF